MTKPEACQYCFRTVPFKWYDNHSKDNIKEAKLHRFKHKGTGEISYPCSACYNMIYQMFRKLAQSQGYAKAYDFMHRIGTNPHSTIINEPERLTREHLVLQGIDVPEPKQKAPAV